MTLRMANGLSDPVDSVMEKIKTQAKKVSCQYMYILISVLIFLCRGSSDIVNECVFKTLS